MHNPSASKPPTTAIQNHDSAPKSTHASATTRLPLALCVICRKPPMINAAHSCQDVFVHLRLSLHIRIISGALPVYIHHASLTSAHSAPWETFSIGLHHEHSLRTMKNHGEGKGTEEKTNLNEATIPSWLLNRSLSIHVLRVRMQSGEPRAAGNK